MSKRFARLRTDVRSDRGLAVAEYAVATVATCGLAGVLYKLLTSDGILGLLFDIIKRALTLVV